MARVVRQSKGMDQLMQRLEELDNSKIQVGWFESAKYDDGTPVAGIMAQNEFGNPSRSIPSRPFLREAINQSESKWRDTSAKGFKAVVEGNRSANQVFNAIGLQVQADIQNSIVTGNFAPLSPITIALRKHRNDGVNIGGKFVGAVAAAIAEGKTGRDELGYQGFGNKDPLRETGYALSTLTYEVS